MVFESFYDDAAYSQNYLHHGLGLDVSNSGLQLQRVSNNAVPYVWRSDRSKPHQTQAQAQAQQSQLKVHQTQAQSQQQHHSTSASNSAPLSNVALKYYEAQLQERRAGRKPHEKHADQHKGHSRTSSDVVYYSPPSSVQTGIAEFLPPTFGTSKSTSSGISQSHVAESIGTNHNSNPANDTGNIGNKHINMSARRRAYMMSNPEIQNTNIDDDDDDLPPNSPAGAWFNPVVKQALARQVNKEEQFRKFALNLMLAAILRYGLSFGGYIKDLYIDLRKQYNPYNLQYHSVGVGSKQALVEETNVEVYASIVVYLGFGILLLNIVTSLYKLLKKQDQCLDLNLSNKQRKMLGLQIVESQEDEDMPRRNKAEDTRSSFAKYVKATPYGTRQLVNQAGSSTRDWPASTGNLNGDDTAGLSYGGSEQHHFLHPKRKQFNTEEVENFSEKFRSTYRLEFDYSDDEA